MSVISDRPLVSILMLSYNNVRFLKRAIDSVLKQTYLNWELILSDDHSDDGSWELIQKLSESDKRIKTYQPENRLGIVRHRLFAFEQSTGDLITHVDGDDEIYPYALQTMLEHITKAVAFAHSDNAWMDDRSQVYQYHANQDPQNNLAYAGWRHLGMYWRWAYDTTDGYNTQLVNACEDGDLFMQIADKHPVMRIPHVLYKHRWHGGNASFGNQKCHDCQERSVCNYIRVWAKHAKVDPLTMKALPT